MFTLLTGDLDTSDPSLADDIYRFRHGFFVEHLKWEACRKPDGRERDQFDGPECLHVVCREGREIVSYARLLPSTRPHLLTHVYPQIMQGGTAPSGPRIYEWTRHAVAAKKRESKGANTFSRAAFGAVAQVIDALDLEGLLVQTHPVIVERLMDMGWDVEPLALPALYDGAMLMPIYARLTPYTVSVGRAACDLCSVGLQLPEIRPHLPTIVHPDRLVA